MDGSVRQQQQSGVHHRHFGHQIDDDGKTHLDNNGNDHDLSGKDKSPTTDGSPKSRSENRKRNLFLDYLRKPAHSHKESLFTSSSGYTNYRGFINLCFILLTISNVRVAIENVQRYGILFNPLQFVWMFFSAPNMMAIITLVSFFNVFVWVSFLVEKSLSGARFRFTFRQLVTVIAINLLIMLVTPPLAFNTSDRFNPIAASFCCIVYTIMFLKLISYHMVNYWYREGLVVQAAAQQNGGEMTNGHEPRRPLAVPVTYPHNLTISDLYYFLFAPTLCYELNFPRNERIRKTFVLKRFLEIVFLLQLEIGLIQQWLVPACQNSLQPFRNMSLVITVERLLKLAVPNHIIWLIFFYLIFHSFLNLIGELMRFADREFYSDWWNSESIEYFWKNWNVIVHKWCVRHVYLPLISTGMTTLNASLVVFLISAFFHEYLVSVPLNMYRVWAFTGMISQVPLSFLVRKLNHKVANYAVWLQLIIGQPLCILMYYHDFYVLHHLAK